MVQGDDRPCIYVLMTLLFSAYTSFCSPYPPDSIAIAYSRVGGLEMAWKDGAGKFWERAAHSIPLLIVDFQVTMDILSSAAKPAIRKAA